MCNLLSKKDLCPYCSAVVCGKLYVYGEENRIIERYDPFSNSWVSLMYNRGVDTYGRPALVNFQDSLFVAKPRKIKLLIKCKNTAQIQTCGRR